MTVVPMGVYRRKVCPRSDSSVLSPDEVGYLSYGNRHADLFFEVVTRRYEERPIVLSTNKPFGEWGEIFPSAACVTAMIERLTQHAEILTIEGKSYRLKEAGERQQRTPTKPTKA